MDTDDDGGWGLFPAVPRGIREAARATSPPPPGAQGYHPTVALSIAAAHRWAAYADFMLVVRSLMMVEYCEPSARSAVRRDLVHLTSRPSPFAVDRRFPADEIYVCLDRAPLSPLLLRVNRTITGFNHGRYFNAVRDLLASLEEGEGAAPLLYTRSVFESAFLVQWLD
ncbi:hypothetical protein OPV22_009990 [Ensete ventricosum]|uniref:Uncharacterized protein n=1 Tax=Ensete ventricosum TaxID=4639 RepID=A0AAV8RK54_ENSVE|nr:hypothetical protein OPV22_009990 [Ensete ventricosum]RWV82057.1 hypothetical protein GW17_00056473 [Ensete ventricosum]